MKTSQFCRKCFCGDTKENHTSDIDPPVAWLCPTPKSSRSIISQQTLSPKSRNSVCPLLKQDETNTITMQTLTVPNKKAHTLPPLILGALASPRRSSVTSTTNTASPQHPFTNVQNNTVGPLFVRVSLF